MKFTLELEPLPQPRPRFSQRGRVYEPAKISAYKKQIRAAALKAMKDAPPINSAVACTIKLFRKFQNTSRRFGDCDNLAKAILDACNGVIWTDDALITSLTTEKFQSAIPRLEVEIETVGTAQQQLTFE